MANIKDVARLAGVSLGTVSNVLNHPDRVGPELKARVESAIAELGFVRSEPARQLRAGQSRTIAVVVLDIANPFFAELIAGAEDVAAAHDAAVIVCNSAGDPARETAHLRHLGQQRVLGVLLSPIQETAAAQLLAAQRSRPPVVFVDRVPTGPGFASVSVDDVHGGALVGELLAAAGHQRVTYVAGPAALRQVTDRLHGLRATFRGHEIDVVHVEEMTIRAGARALGELYARPADRRPQALFCANDLLAIGAVNAAMRLGIAVPQELAIVGYDDIDFAETAGVALTTVRQPAREIGRRAAQLLLEEVADPTAERPTVVFRPELVTRTSSGPAPAGSLMEHRAG
ncbi:LacI family transcriptional regulator [Streptomyces sp. SID14478]|uniref:LacI family DNA-binding transcriptional regulator n=1 Tax=Streptomyces sp. SID14478 TaxID=2706073 RepID=UPI0013DCDDEF|nr:LacI family DNA-binding transcriptional regulator [Streptomyces sp. SID14478]NEB75811.1 LacI family transcriptional regulator [Streptomyces sp. SID14478]